MKVNNKVSNHIIESFGIDTTVEYESKKINARQLLVSDRIDLIAKYKYVEAKDKNIDSNFFKNLYMNSISAFSNGSFNEPGNKNKNNFEKYIDVFDKLIKDIKENGFNSNISLIPVGENNIIIDGAHRTSICAYYNKIVNTIYFPKTKVKYDIDFFKSRCLDTIYLDYMCYEYIKIKNKDIYIFCIWPRCNNNEQNLIKKRIYDSCKVIYEKKINLSYKGLRNFMIQIYGNQDWIGNINNKFKNAIAKVEQCYGKNNLTCMVVEESNLDKIRELKEKIRKEIGFGNHSLHSTDNITETIEMAELLLNRNSIHFLNNADIDKFPRFYKKIDDLKKQLKENSISEEDVLIDSSSVMAAYGLRENNDVDILVNNEIYDKYNEILLDTHNSCLKNYEKTLDEMIYNPENYFIFKGMKFLNIELVKKMKERRNGKNDIHDIKLISEKLYMPISNKEQIILFFRRKLVYLKNRFRICVVNFLKRIHLYDSVKKIYKTWRKK